MKEKEQLILSDYVSWDGEIVQIVELRQDWCIVTKDYEQPQVQYAEVKYEELEPIPLTEEILEKNEFEYYEPYDPEIKTEGYKSNDNRIRIRREKTSKGNWFCIIYTKGMMEQLMLGISYVHELQHALKLCNISKTIII